MLQTGLIPEKLENKLMPFPMKAEDIFLYGFLSLGQVHAIKSLHRKTY